MRNPRADEKISVVRATNTPYELARGQLTLTVTKNVYPTSELSEIFVEIMDDPKIGIRPGFQVLDYGTGTGYLAVEAALRGAEVIALDVNPAAITCAAINMERYAVSDRISLRCGRNLTQIYPQERFDQIYAGMPWDDHIPEDALESALYDENFIMRRSLFDNACNILKINGCVYFSSAEGHYQKYPEIYSHPDLFFQIVGRRMIKGLEHFVVQGTPARQC